MDYEVEIRNEIERLEEHLRSSRKRGIRRSVGWFACLAVYLSYRIFISMPDGTSERWMRVLGCFALCIAAGFIVAALEFHFRWRATVGQLRTLRSRHCEPLGPYRLK